MRIILILIAFIFLSACAERGCTDPDGENYEPAAKKDCSCCFYSGKVYVWYSSDYYTETFVSGLKADSVKLFLDGKLVKTGLARYDQTSPVLLDATRSYGYYTQDNRFYLVLLKELGQSKSVNGFLRVTTEHNNLLWEGNINIQANKILQVKIG